MAKKSFKTLKDKKEIQEALKLYEDFTGHEPEKIEVADVPTYNTALVVGPCLGIMYEAIRDGKKDKYLHKFKKKSRPLLCVSHDGQQIIVIDGNYLFTAHGIEDT